MQYSEENRSFYTPSACLHLQAHTGYYPATLCKFEAAFDAVIRMLIIPVSGPE